MKKKLDGLFHNPKKQAIESAHLKGYQAVANSARDSVKGDKKCVTQFLNHDACVCHMMEQEGHSKEGAERVCNAILNGGPGSGIKGHTTQDSKTEQQSLVIWKVGEKSGIRQATTKSDDAFEQIKAAGGKNVRTTSNGIHYTTPSGEDKTLEHRDRGDGHRYVKPSELKEHLKRLQ
jgi:hypothetical protein